METLRSIEDVKAVIGQETGVSDWVEITQDRINQFADATGDHQWIHLDTERAATEMPNGKTIAHGFLTLSLIPMLTGGMLKMENVTRGINYGCNKVRFTNMVPVGSKVRARSVLKNAEEKSGGIQITNEVTIEMEGAERPACVAETLSVVYFG